MADQPDLRRAGERGEYTHVHPGGEEHTLRAEEHESGYWVVRPTDADEEALADAFGLPRAQKAIKADKTAGNSGDKEA